MLILRNRKFLCVLTGSLIWTTCSSFHIYIPDKYLDKVSYNQALNVTTSTGNQTGNVNYIALKHEYTPKDEQSTYDSKHLATKMKVAITDSDGILKSDMPATVEVPLI